MTTGGTANGPLFQMTGGTMTVGAFAMGDHARAIVHNHAAALKEQGRDEVLARLTALTEALAAHGAALPDKVAAEGLVERIAKEAARPAPDKLTLKSFLAGLADEVKSVSTIASAVMALSGPILALFV